MKIGVNSKTSQVDLYRSRVVRRLIACLALIFISLMIETAAAAPEDEVRATFDRFVAAQNAHDVKAVESLLLGSPDFLWHSGHAGMGARCSAQTFCRAVRGDMETRP